MSNFGTYQLLNSSLWYIFHSTFYSASIGATEMLELLHLFFNNDIFLWVKSLIKVYTNEALSPFRMYYFDILSKVPVINDHIHINIGLKFQLLEC